MQGPRSLSLSSSPFCFPPGRPFNRFNRQRIRAHPPEPQLAEQASRCWHMSVTEQLSLTGLGLSFAGSCVSFGAILNRLSQVKKGLEDVRMGQEKGLEDVRRGQEKGLEDVRRGQEVSFNELRAALGPLQQDLWMRKGREQALEGLYKKNR